MAGVSDNETTAAPGPAIKSGVHQTAAGNSAASSAAAAALQFLPTEAQIQSLLITAKKQRWLTAVRPLSEFIEPTQFTKPRTLNEASSRLELNINYFLTNYLFIVITILIIAVIAQPTLLILLLILVLIWLYIYQTESIVIGTTILSGRRKLIITGIISGILLFLFAGSVILICIGLASIIIVTHGIFHILPDNTNSNSDDNEQTEGLLNTV